MIPQVQNSGLARHGNKPTEYIMYIFFTVDPACFGLNGHHQELRRNHYKLSRLRQCPFSPKYAGSIVNKWDRVYLVDLRRKFIKKPNLWNSEPASQRARAARSRWWRCVAGTLSFILTLAASFIHSLVFSVRGRAGRNQSPVM